MSSTPAFHSTKLIALDGQSNDWFGTSVAVDGDLALVGAQNATVNGDASRGAAYVFKKVHGVWSQVQKLVASDGAFGDQFGQVVAIFNGKTIIITAPLARVNGRHWQGAAYVFTFVAGRWVEKQKLTPSDGTVNGTFGKSVALNGSHALIGAGGASLNNVHVLGSVYVFDFAGSPTGGAWNEVQRILAPDPNDDTAMFGNAVAISRNTVLVGAYGSTVRGNLGQGIVYVFNLIGGIWQLSASMTASDGASRDNFGVSLGFQTTSAFIGAQGATVNGNQSQGAVYHFDLAGSTWVESQKLTALDGAGINLFGASVNYAGSRVLIGAYGANSYRGAAYIFGPTATGGSWAQRRKLTASDGHAQEVFGHFTALDSRTALISAYTADVAGNPDQGAAYAYDLGPIGP
jgi:hypothetical protein